MSAKTFLVKNWLGIAGIFIGIALACYFHRVSIASRKPCFLIDTQRTIIVDSKHFSETPLQVVRSDGSKIKGDITSVRFYFYNNGKKSIRPANILVPLVVSLKDKNGEILDYKILKTSREVVQPMIDRDSTNPKQNLTISFNILEQNDGLTCQLIFTGNPNAGFKISGTIEGVKDIITNPSLIRKIFLGQFGKVMGVLLLATFIFLGFTLFYFKYFLTDSRRRRDFAIIFLIILLIFLYVGLVKVLFYSSKKIAAQNVVQVVPKDIIP